MDENKHIVILPGENISSYLSKAQQNESKIVISKGLYKVNEHSISACQSGLLKIRSPLTYYVENKSTFYIPVVGDQVVGVIEDKGADFYRVNIFSSSPAILARLAFEGATKRNKPELKRGDSIYARVTMAHRDLDTELVCTVASGPKRDWSTGENIYGELSGEGVLVHLPSVSDSRRLLDPNCLLLNTLGRHFPYEIAIGVNGVAWLRASSTVETVAIRNAILNMDKLTDDARVVVMVERLAELTKKMIEVKRSQMSAEDS